MKKIYDALGSERLSRMLCLKTGILYSTVMKRLNALKADNKIDCEKRQGKGSVLPMLSKRRQLSTRFSGRSGLTDLARAGNSVEKVLLA